MTGVEIVTYIMMIAIKIRPEIDDKTLFDIIIKKQSHINVKDLHESTIDKICKLREESENLIFDKEVNIWNYVTT